MPLALSLGVVLIVCVSALTSGTYEI